MHLWTKLRQQLTQSEPATLPQKNHTALGAGTVAPNFQLESSKGDLVSLENLQGQPVILAFYPADHTPVCSSQLALYNGALPIFAEYKAHLLGISVDNPDSHQSFANSLELDFPLLSDNSPQGAVASAYGVFDEAGGTCQRALFVIDGDGVIRWSDVVPNQVNPGAQGILAALEALTA